jgi:hypothetical protein
LFCSLKKILRQLAMASPEEEAQLRERLSSNSGQAKATQSAKEKVLELNGKEAERGDEKKEKKTYGRTPDGTGTLHRCQLDISHPINWETTSIDQRLMDFVQSLPSRIPTTWSLSSSRPRSQRTTQI